MTLFLPLQTSQQAADPATVDALNALVTNLNKTSGVVVSSRKQDSTESWIFTLSGPYQSVLAVKAVILREAPLQASPSRHLRSAI
jgi:hypothetical protein